MQMHPLHFPFIFVKIFHKQCRCRSLPPEGGVRGEKLRHISSNECLSRVRVIDKRLTSPYPLQRGTCMRTTPEGDMYAYYSRGGHVYVLLQRWTCMRTAIWHLIYSFILV